MAAASSRGIAWVWDLATESRLAQFDVGSTEINDLKFNPTDSRYIATGDHEGRILYWDWKAKTGEKDHWILHQADGTVDHIAFNTWGQFLAASVSPKFPLCSYGASPPDIYQVLVIALDETNKAVTLSGHTALIRDISFSPTRSRDDWPYLVTASNDGTACVYNLARAYQLEQPNFTPVVLRHGDIVWSANFDSTGEYVVTSGTDRVARVWNPSIGFEQLARNGPRFDIPSLITLRGHSEDFSTRFDADGKYILSTSGDGTARVWRNDARRVKYDIETGQINGATFDPTGAYFLTTGASLSVWKANNRGREPEAVLSDGASQNSYWGASFSGDGRAIIAMTEQKEQSNTSRRVDFWEWREAASRSTPHHFEVPGYLTGIAVSNNKEGPIYVVTASAASKKVWSAEVDDKNINAARIWKINSDLSSSQVTVLIHPQPVMAVAFSGDQNSRYLATASAKGVRIFDWAHSNTPLVHLSPETTFQSVAFSRDGRYVAAVQMAGPPLIWEWQSEAERKHPLILRTPDSFESIATVAFNPDSTLAVTAGGNGMLRLWDLATGDELQIIDFDTRLRTSASFSPDGRYLIVPYSSATRIYECPECMEQTRLPEIVNQRVSVETLRDTGSLNNGSPAPANKTRSRRARQHL